MESGDFFVESLRQHVDLADFVLVRVTPQLDLGQGLIGEGVGHDKGRVPCRAAQVHKAARRKQNDMSTILEGITIDLSCNEM